MQDRGRPPRQPGQRDAAGGPRRPITRRPISPRSPLEGRQLWRIGDWGGASEQIGRQWERLGVARINALLGHERVGPGGDSYTPVRGLVLVNDLELAAQVQAHGKSHADAILVGVHNGRSVLEPVDFKWTLETANPRQVGAEVLADLLSEPPQLLADRLGEILADLPVDGETAYIDGIFLAPDHAMNRAYLAPAGPLDPAWAVLCPVEALEFFSPLIGWDIAQVLARADGIQLRTLEVTERYYRLGAGVLGALRKLQSSVFDEKPPEVDGQALLARLRRERRLMTTGDLIAYCDRALLARGELVDKLRDVERAGYPYSRYREDLKARGGLGSDDKRASRLFGQIMKVLAQEIRAEGRRLRDAGRADLDALAVLDAQRSRWQARGRALLDARLGPRLPLASDGDNTPDAVVAEPSDALTAEHHSAGD
jgi:hypothetical protein